MPRKKKKQPAQRPAPMRWEFDPDTPTHDFLEEGPLTDLWNLQQAVENFVSWVEEGQFLTWEAVICEEQGLPLTPQQEEALHALLSFGAPPHRPHPVHQRNPTAQRTLARPP